MVENKKFRVLRMVLPESADEYPEIYRHQSKEHPELLEWIEDESVTLIQDIEKGTIYNADEFFHMEWIQEFNARVITEDDPLVIWPKE